MIYTKDNQNYVRINPWRVFTILTHQKFPQIIWYLYFCNFDNSNFACLLDKLVRICFKLLPLTLNASGVVVVGDGDVESEDVDALATTLPINS